MKSIRNSLVVCTLLFTAVQLLQGQTFNFLLSGEQATSNNEVTGSAGWAAVTVAGNTVTYTAHFEGFSALNAAHFHGPAARGSNAGVVAGIATGGESSPVIGTLDFTDEQIADLLAGQLYLNFHTPENPGGEIRGQVVQQLDFTPTTLLSGFQETAEAGVPAAGAARVVFNENTGELTWTVVYEGLTGAATGMHFHGPAAAGQNAGVKIDIGGASGLESGTTGSTMLTSPDDIDDLLAGLWYINVHTAANPGGEIRGQVEPLVVSNDSPEAIVRTFLITGSQSTANSDTTGSAGWATTSLVGNTLSYSVHFTGFSSLNAAHFHGPAASLSTAGVVAGIAEGGESSPVTGSVELTGELISDYINGNHYLNFHTPENPGGEIRGQVVPQMDFIPNNLLSGSQTTDNLQVLGGGAAEVTFNVDTNELSWKVFYQGLTGDATAMHFHGPAPLGENGGVTVDIGGNGGLQPNTSGSVILEDEQQISDLLNGLWYINVHTAANPGGEIRGQVTDVFLVEEVDPLPWEAVAVGETGLSPWFGSFEVFGNDWVLNAEQGWLYVGLIEDSNSMWFYSFVRDAWIWSSEGIYPICYDASTAQWIVFIQIGSGSFVLDYATNQWTFNP